MTRRTQLVYNSDISSAGSPAAPAATWKIYSLFTQHLHVAAGELGRSSYQMCRLPTYRVRRVMYRRYAVRLQTGQLPRWNPDSPAAAWDCFSLFHTIFAHSANVVWNKAGFFRPAGGESGRLSRHMPGLEPPRTSC